ncbi:MAG: type II secretion system F family protein [Actinomycetota bacterium]
MIATLLLGAGFGLGLFCIVAALRLRRPPLVAVLARLETTSLPATAGRDVALSRRFGRHAAGALQQVGIRAPRGADADLRATGRTEESLAVERLTVALCGAALGVASSQILAAAGLAVPLGVRLVFPVALAAGGFHLPLFTLRSVAAERRRQARVGVGAYLDLVGVALSAGAGVEEAMVDAARIGDGWVFDELAAALTAARRSGEPPWVALARLGTDLGVAELAELAATLSLAGTEGARARDSLLAKARSLRRDQLAQTEASALRRTEAAHLPLVLQLVGFVALLLYPAFLRLMAGLA